MKRFIFAFILLVVSFAAVGCSKEEENKRARKEPTPELTPLEKVNALMRSKQLPLIRQIHEWKDYVGPAVLELQFYRMAWQSDSTIRAKQESGNPLTREEIEDEWRTLRIFAEGVALERARSVVNGEKKEHMGYYGSTFNWQRTIETIYYFDKKIENVLFVVKKRNVKK